MAYRAKYTWRHMTAASRFLTFAATAQMEEKMVADTTSHRTAPVPSSADRAQSGAFLEWAGWSGLLGTLAFIVTIVMTTGGVSGPDGSADMARFLADVSDGGSLGYVYGVAGIVLVVLYIPMAVGIYRLLGRSAAAWNGSAAVVFGLAVLLPAYLINLLPSMAFVPLAAELGSTGGEILYADYSIARSGAELFFTVGSVLSLGLGPLLLGLAWLRSSERGRWLGWAGVLTGATGMVWFVWLIDNALFGYLLIANVVVSLVYFTGVSVVLVSRGRAES